MQAVDNNKLRHQTLQEFMLFTPWDEASYLTGWNDSVTIASEVPILLDQEDIAHYHSKLGFDIPEDLLKPKVITGHIDLIQVRNGAIYIHPVECWKLLNWGYERKLPPLSNSLCSY